MGDLTDKELKNLKPRAKLYKVTDRDGMHAAVTPTGVISFRYQYRVNGRQEVLTIGRYSAEAACKLTRVPDALEYGMEVSLAEARALLARARRELGRLDIVPQPFPVVPRFRHAIRQQHLGLDDAAFVGEIVAAFEPVVAQPRGRAVGGGRHCAGACLAADNLDVEMIDRHRGQIIYTAKRTSERRISAPSRKRFS
jgi:hypothetical protein